MTISDKTRKLLWGQSGNRCAFCGRNLVMAATKQDSESIVGDECHIIARRSDGPRGDVAISEEELDDYFNLILLCKVHHKLIDDQPQTFTVDRLREMKQKHEKWVQDTLHQAITNRDSNAPIRMHIIETGKEALSIVIGAEAFDFNYDEPENRDEMKLIGGFLQGLQDLGDLGMELDASQRTEAAFALTQEIRVLDERGFFVFGTTQIRKISFADGPMDMLVAMISVIRKSHSDIATTSLMS